MATERNQSRGMWTSREAYLLALACLVSGLLMGYLLRGTSPGVPSAGTIPAGAAASAPPMGGTAPATAETVQPLAAPLLAALKADPNNADTLISLGNLYYDQHVYPQAIQYYTRALAVRPNDANVRTDLGTAYWYSNLPNQAVAEYEKSLKLVPTHPNALFNMGIVRSDGLHDYKGAVAAWEKLLQTNPQYPERQRVQDLIAKAQNQPQGK
jgi:cytochrome c-type biogenesis protein CcmH/NrfG